MSVSNDNSSYTKKSATGSKLKEFGNSDTAATLHESLLPISLVPTLQHFKLPLNLVLCRR